MTIVYTIALPKLPVFRHNFLIGPYLWEYWHAVDQLEIEVYL